MLKDAIKVGHRAKYVLFDSWFATPKGITDIRKKLSLDVLAMLKKSSKVFYEYQNQQMDLKKIYAMNRKRPGRSKYLLSVEVNLIQKEKGKSSQGSLFASSLSAADPIARTGSH